MRKSLILAAVIAAATVAGCDKKPPSATQVRPVRTITVERVADGETVSLTGQVRAKDEVSLAFRVDGRVIERPVNVGDILQPTATALEGWLDTSRHVRRSPPKTAERPGCG